MNTQRIAIVLVAVLCGVVSNAVDRLDSQLLAAELGAVDSQSDVQILSRGPIHEAFAEPVLFEAKPGNVVPQEPPAPVEELPPEQKPEGENIQWLAGYWHWDLEAEGFVWVSGFWRAMPPGRQWVPGYWMDVAGGFRWVSGFWATSKSDSIEYLSEPPRSLEVGPSTDSPSADHYWVPGNWEWSEHRYVWRVGCWTLARRNWIWVPSYYSWTPRGFICVSGYWDYPLCDRGLLYAPVAFRPGAWTRPGFSFSPTFALDLTILPGQFFVRPQCNHYYFGDYHSPRFEQRGVVPWFAFQSSFRGYDPIYAHHHHHHDQDSNEQLRATYRRHRDAHPGSDADGDRRERSASQSIVKAVDQLSPSADLKMTLERVNPARREVLAHSAREANQLAKQRRELETQTSPSDDGKSRSESRPSRLPRIPNSQPVASTAGEERLPAPPKPVYSKKRADPVVTARPAEVEHPVESAADDSKNRRPASREVDAVETQKSGMRAGDKPSRTGNQKNEQPGRSTGGREHERTTAPSEAERPALPDRSTGSFPKSDAIDSRTRPHRTPEVEKTEIRESGKGVREKRPPANGSESERPGRARSESEHERPPVSSQPIRRPENQNAEARPGPANAAKNDRKPPAREQPKVAPDSSFQRQARPNLPTSPSGGAVSKPDRSAPTRSPARTAPAASRKPDSAGNSGSRSKSSKKP